MTPTDAAFLKAITTIKSISRGPNALGKPPPKRKVELYGLYKQATEGDVNGIMPRPEGADPQTRANQMKWDAWKSQEGKSKQEAKLDYVAYLLETIRSLVPGDSVASLPPQWLELEQSYEAARGSFDRTLATGPQHRPIEYDRHGHGRRLSIGSVNSTYSHFLRNPSLASPRDAVGTYSEFGLSEKDRSELQADQLVDRLQSVYPPVIPGAVPSPAPFGGELPWTVKPSSTARSIPLSESDRAGPGNGHNGGGPTGIAQLIWKIQRSLVRTIEGLFRRLFVDVVTLVALAAVLRLLATRPHLLQKSPVLQGVTKTLIRVGVVVLDGFGVELKLKTPRASPSRALHRP